MNRVTRTGLRLFVLTAPAGVALLAVATDAPVVMLLVAVPGVVVLYVLHLDRHRATDPAARGPGTVQGTTARTPPSRNGPGNHRAVARPDDHDA